MNDNLSCTEQVGYAGFGQENVLGELIIANCASRKVFNHSSKLAKKAGRKLIDERIVKDSKGKIVCVFNIYVQYDLIVQVIARNVKCTNEVLVELIHERIEAINVALGQYHDSIESAMKDKSLHVSH